MLSCKSGPKSSSIYIFYWFFEVLNSIFDRILFVKTYGDVRIQNRSHFMLINGCISECMLITGDGLLVWFDFKMLISLCFMRLSERQVLLKQFFIFRLFCFDLIYDFCFLLMSLCMGSVLIVQNIFLWELLMINFWRLLFLWFHVQSQLLYSALIISNT